MRVTAAIALLLLSPPVLAQPSFDCAKASTAVERTICKSADLAKADREMAALYGGLSGRLAGAAKDHLGRDQLRWNANRTTACTTELERCLQDKYASRIERLKFLGTGAYPFISDQAIVRTGKVKATRFVIDASYPQFDGATADFTALNSEFANLTRKAVADATPDKDIAGDIDQTWGYDQRFALHRPAPHLVAIEFTDYTFTGGAHGNGGVTAMLVDLRTGRFISPFDVLAPGEVPFKAVVETVQRDVRRQFKERPGFDESLEIASLGKAMRNPRRWLFKADGLTIVFNQYEVGPYAAGPYEVDIPYVRLGKVIRADGPLAR